MFSRISRHSTKWLTLQVERTLFPLSRREGESLVGSLATQYFSVPHRLTAVCGRKSIVPRFPAWFIMDPLQRVVPTEHRASVQESEEHHRRRCGTCCEVDLRIGCHHNPLSNEAGHPADTCNTLGCGQSETEATATVCHRESKLWALKSVSLNTTTVRASGRSCIRSFCADHHRHALCRRTP